MSAGQQFPPLLVVFDGAEYWLVDGFQRRWAAIKAKIEKFKCLVIEGTREDARWLSYGANKDHGLPRTNDDKKNAVLAALKHPKGAKKSDGQIAEHVGVSDRMVNKYRAELEVTSKLSESPKRTGRDGRTTNTTNIGRKKRAGQGDELPADPPPLPKKTAAANGSEQSKEPTPFDHLKHWWAQASDIQKSLFRDWIDTRK